MWNDDRPLKCNKDLLELLELDYMGSAWYLLDIQGGGVIGHPASKEPVETLTTKVRTRYILKWNSGLKNVDDEREGLECDANVLEGPKDGGDELEEPEDTVGGGEGLESIANVLEELVDGGGELVGSGARVLEGGGEDLDVVAENLVVPLDSSLARSLAEEHGDVWHVAGVLEGVWGDQESRRSHENGGSCSC